MMDIKNIKSVYFLGIGGIGMSALARYYNSIGVKVSGYDKTPTPLTKKLQEEGIDVHFDDNLEKIEKGAAIVVYTPAIPKNHQELNFYKNNNYNLLKRSDLLGLVTKETYSICVAGTHGKTTTSAMVAHIFRDSRVGCNAFLGGIASNYNTNFWSSKNNVSVAEADEYDRSFLKLHPTVAIITAMDADHLDIYGDEATMQDAFIEFSQKVDAKGLLILNNNIKRRDDFRANNLITYALDDTTADAYVENLQSANGSYSFDVQINQKRIGNLVLNMGGMHNVENALAAIIAAEHYGVPVEAIREALANFKGVKRRFEYIIKTDRMVMIDDYAHHPEELRALIVGAKNLFPDKKCTIVFQPHLFSRTKDLAEGFAKVLDLADEVLLLPIYPARELPMVGVSSGLIFDKMQNANKKMLSKDELLHWVKNNSPEMFITSGAGDVDVMVEPIKNILEQK